METQKYQMWDILKDFVNGFKGQVIGITHYSTGCIHYGLAPLKCKEDGSVPDLYWQDQSRLSFIKKGPCPQIDKPRSGPDLNPRCQ